ncbi:MAG TPA: ABC transporter substrate-binding protein [Kiloniellaceae bacterium]
MTLYRLRSCALAILLLAAPAAGQAAETPTATVQRLNAALLETMKNAEALGYRGRYEKLAPVLTETFDFPAMAKVVMGGHWTSIGTAHEEAFTAAFTEYSIGVFANRFDGYSGETFEVVGEQPARRGTVLVQNRIVKSDGEAVAINFLARQDEDGNWRIVDTILGGAYSELAARRSEYDGIVEKLGIDALINALKDKTADFAD